MNPEALIFPISHFLKDMSPSAMALNQKLLAWPGIIFLQVEVHWWERCGGHINRSSTRVRCGWWQCAEGAYISRDDTTSAVIPGQGYQWRSWYQLISADISCDISRYQLWRSAQRAPIWRRYHQWWYQGRGVSVTQGAPEVEERPGLVKSVCYTRSHQILIKPFNRYHTLFQWRWLEERIADWSVKNGHRPIAGNRTVVVPVITSRCMQWCHQGVSLKWLQLWPNIR